MKELTEDILDPNLVSGKLIDLEELEDICRGSNFRIDKITEQPNETWDECEEKVVEVIRDQWNIGNLVDKRKYNRPRPIIFELNKFKDKQKIRCNVKKLKSTGIYIYEDLVTTQCL